MITKTPPNFKHYVLFIMLLCCATFAHSQDLPKNLNQDFLKRYQAHQQSLKKDREALKNGTKSQSKSSILPQNVEQEMLKQYEAHKQSLKKAQEAAIAQSEAASMRATSSAVSVASNQLSDATIGNVLSDYLGSDTAKKEEVVTLYGEISDWDVSNVTSMSGLFSNSSFNEDIGAWNVSNVTDMSYMFYLNTAFNQDLSTWVVSKVTDMSAIFAEAPFNQNLSDWNVSNVTDMSYMFYNNTAFNQDLSGWDVGSVTDMSRMFTFASDFNQDLSGWNVSSVTNMYAMFYNTSSDQDLSAWDVTNVTNMEYMFNGTLSRENYDAILNGWAAQEVQSNVTLRVGNTTYCAGGKGRAALENKGWIISDGGRDTDPAEACPIVFSNPSLITAVAEWNADADAATANYGAINTWDVSSVTSMYGLFSNSSFNEDISAWNVSSVTSMYGMFYKNTAFNQDLSAWVVSSVTNMSLMFYEATFFNGDISSWDVSSVTDMSYMFYKNTAFNQDLSAWVVSSVTNMSLMFYEATFFNGDISSWDVSSVTDMSYMFKGATAFNQDISTWDVSKVTDFINFIDNSAISVENYDALFTGWSALTLQQGVTFSNSNLQYCTARAARQSIIDDYGWEIIDAGLALGCHNSSVKTPITQANFRTAINNCLTTNPADGLCSGSEYGAMKDWDVSQVTDMSDAFREKKSFNGDISSWNVTNVTNMYRMFFIAPAFNQDISAWDVSNVTDMTGVFYEATSFNQDLSTWVVSSVTTMYYMFQNATSFNQDLSAWQVSNLTNMSYMFQNATSFNQDLSTWQVSNVTDMSNMFNEATSFNQDLSAWNVTNVTNMEYMFSGTLSRENYDAILNGWAAQEVQSNVTLTIGNTTYCSGGRGKATLENKGWIISDGGRATDTEEACPIVFSNPSLKAAVVEWNADADAATAKYGAINTWDVSQVTNMVDLFANNQSFNEDISAWDVSKVTNMQGVFYFATSFNQDLSGWDVSSVTNMPYMFDGAASFNQDLSAWDVSSVTDMYRMLNSTAISMENYNAILNGWAAKEVQENVDFGAQGLSYCDGEVGRNMLIEKGWVITGDNRTCAAPTLVLENLTKKYGDPSFDIVSSSNSQGTVAYEIVGEANETSLSGTNNATVTLGNVAEITIRATQAISGMYDAASEEFTVTIAKASLTATAEDKTRLYGQDNPTFTISYDGFKGTDSATDLDTMPTASSAARVASDAGTHGIELTDGADANYAITHASGTLTIGKAPLTVTAGAGYTKVYGAAEPTFTYVVSGLVNGDVATDLETISISRNAGEAVGSYTITTVASDANYEVTVETADFSITAASLTITGLKGDNKVYDGTSDATASGTPVLSGVVSDDDVVLGGTPVFAFASTELGTDIQITTTGFIITGADSGNYTLTQSTLSADIVTTLGVDDITDEKLSLKLYPNPSINYIRVRGLSEKANYTIYNLLGKEVGKGMVENDEDITIQNLSNGTYFIRIENAKAIRFIKM